MPTLPCKRFFFIFLSLFFCFSMAFSQTKKKKVPALTKAEKAQFIKDSTEIVRVRLVRPQFRVDNRNLFFKNQVLNVSGFDVGVLLKNKLRLTLGYYSFSNNLNTFEKTVDDVKYNRQFKLSYGSLNTEIIYASTRYFSLGMPLEFGFGNNQLQYSNTETGEISSKESGFLFMADFGLSATFKPIRWIGLKGMLGYRKTVYNQVKDFQFDCIFTSIGLNVDIREFIKDIQMFSLKRKYKRGNSVENAVDLITD